MSNNNLQGSTPQCDCLPGYSGQTCQNSVCDNKHCSNGGTCLIDSKGRAKCNCTVFYNGTECKGCACENGGKCDTSKTAVSCSCPEEFTGRLCEQKVQSRSGAQSTSSIPTIVGIIVGALLLLVIIIVIVIFIIRRKNRNPFKHQRMNGMDVQNPVYRERDADEEARNMNQFDLEDHDHFGNTSYDPRLFQAESTDVLLPKESDQDNNIIEGNGNIYRKKNKKKAKGAKK